MFSVLLDMNLGVELSAGSFGNSVLLEELPGCPKVAICLLKTKFLEAGTLVKWAWSVTAGCVCAEGLCVGLGHLVPVSWVCDKCFWLQVGPGPLLSW